MKSKKKQSTASQSRHMVESLEDRRVLAVTYLESVAFEGDMSRSQEIEVADFDGDGDLDAIALSGAGAVMFSNNGDGTFASPVSVASLVGDGRSLEVADFDKDGDADFAIGSIGGDTLTWHRNDGSGNFSEAQALEQTETFGFVDALEVADIDGDGDFDILAVSRVLYGDSIYQIAKFENTDGAGTFGPAVTITADFKDPREVHAVDMDGDGDLDLVGASSYISEDETIQEHKIFWFNNTDGQGNFSLVESITSGLEPRFMDNADFDGDGDLDLIIPQQEENTIIMVENAGGAFGTVTILESDFTGPERVIATDFDDDGDADFLATIDTSGIVALYTNDGTGDFTRSILSDTTEQASGLDVADFDEDGDLDVFSTSQFAAAATLHANNGDGTFTDVPLSGPNAVGPLRAVMADIDGDGDQDFIGQSTWDLEIAWYENDGSGSYGAQTIIANSSLPPNTLIWFDVDAGDMDGDGDIDVITSEPVRDQIVWYENDGSGGTWTPHFEGAAGAGTLEIVLADMEGDGDLDVLTSQYFFGNVAWYVNDGTGSLTELNVGEFEALYRIRVDAADIDGDGDQDVIAGSYMYYSSPVVTWFENVNGVFDEVQALWTPSNPVSSGVNEIISADFDGDGDIDVATSLFEDNGYDVVSWYENTDGAGTFAATSTFITDEFPLHFNLYAIDMDGDGDMDLLTEGYYEESIQWFANDGNGNFTEKVQVATDTLLIGDLIAVGDVDGNNLPDIIAPFGADNTFRLYKAVSDEAVVGDFNGDGLLDIADLDALCAEVAAGTNGSTYDLDNNGSVNADDVLMWVVDIKGTTIGDSNLDGVFNSTDFIVVFTVGEYEDGVANNSTWAEGDWNCDGEFDTADLVFAFTIGGFSATAVPGEVLDQVSAAIAITDSVADNVAEAVEQPQLVANSDVPRERVLQAAAIDEIFARADDRHHGKAKQDGDLQSDFS